MPNETIQHIATVFPIGPEALKPHPRLQRRVSIVKDFSLNTSTHGIPSIARSTSIPNRIFWTIASIAFAGIMTFFIVQAIRAYFEYPSQTSVSVIVEWPQAFPAVTICNYGILRYDRFIGPYFNYLKMRNVTNTTNTDNLTYEQSLYIYDFLIYKLNRNEPFNDYFYSLDIMLMNCNYNGILCSAANFTQFISASYGLCYTFNARMKNVDNGGVRNNSDYGGYGLLQLRFYTYQHLYVPYLTLGSGMVGMVHDNAELPAIELGVMFFGPGQHHRLTYTKRENTFLPAPYTNCNNQVNAATQLMFDQYNGTDYGYSQYECFIPCIQLYTYQKCGCINPFRWASSSIILPGTNNTLNPPFCAIDNPCYTNAGSELMNTHSIWSTLCSDCTQECSTTDFTIKSSSLAAPPAYLRDSVVKFVESTNVPLPADWNTSQISEIQSSYVSMEVSYETTRTEVYTEQATLSAVDVISNVGGQTGLWIGISFLSLMEIAEMIFRLTRYQGHSIRKSIKKRFRSRTVKISE